MMKQVYLFLVLIITCWGCQDMKVGYLKAENAGYLPNELEVKKNTGSGGRCCQDGE